MRQLLRVFLLHILLAVSVLAQQSGSTVCHLGVAPLLGPCHSRERLMRLSVQNRSVLRAAVIQAGHSEGVADQVVQMLCLGQATEVRLRNGTALATMAWYGVDSSGSLGVHTLWNPRLELGNSVPCWQIKVTVEAKTIIFVLPKACGNLARLGVTTRVTIRTELPPPPRYIPPPPITLTWAPGANERLPDKGSHQNMGATVSSGEIRFFPKPGDTNVCVSGVSSASANSNSSSSSATGPININNQNNNINQAQNVVPVNVVVNTGPGNASGTATGTGNQDASGNQNNGP